MLHTKIKAPIKARNFPSIALKTNGFFQRAAKSAAGSNQRQKIFSKNSFVLPSVLFPSVNFPLFPIDTGYKCSTLVPMTRFIQSSSVFSALSAVNYPIRVHSRFLPSRKQLHNQPHRFAPMCSYVHLRAPTCAKNEKFPNAAQTAHKCTFPISRLWRTL